MLVEFPGVLLAGFSWTLKQIQRLASNENQLAFSSAIAPTIPTTVYALTPPTYSTREDFTFDLGVLEKDCDTVNPKAFLLRPWEATSTEWGKAAYIETLSARTTLDGGQAVALYETLERGLAFTQGPPGTGKTFLGVAISRVVLASRRGYEGKKPILAVCMTNHALDSFLEDLKSAGITKLARLGQGSKETWTQQHQLRTLSSKMRHTRYERQRLYQSRLQIEGLYKEGLSWSESLNNDISMGWPAIRGHLQERHPPVFQAFAGLEAVDESRLSVRIFH